jgi:hypothetical protein
MMVRDGAAGAGSGRRLPQSVAAGSRDERPGDAGDRDAVPPTEVAEDV